MEAGKGIKNGPASQLKSAFDVFVLFCMGLTVVLVAVSTTLWFRPGHRDLA